MRQRTIKRRVSMYRGSSGRVASNDVPNKTDCTLPADDPNAVECTECGAFVRRLVTGRPRAHAAGGLITNTRAGRYKCPGSGVD